MQTIWAAFITFCTYLPWVAVALVAGLAMRRKYSAGLLMQAFGAAAQFLLAIVGFVVIWILQWASAPYYILTDTAIIFRFLQFLALLIFTVGFCMERLKRNGGAGFPVSATRVS